MITLRWSVILWWNLLVWWPICELPFEENLEGIFFSPSLPADLPSHHGCHRSFCFKSLAFTQLFSTSSDTYLTCQWLPMTLVGHLLTLSDVQLTKAGLALLLGCYRASNTTLLNSSLLHTQYAHIHCFCPHDNNTPCADWRDKHLGIVSLLYSFKLTFLLGKTFSRPDACWWVEGVLTCVTRIHTYCDV